MKWLIGIIVFSLFLVAQVSFCYAGNVSLEWDANTEEDLAGYKIYYKTGSSGSPYNGTGAAEGNSPVDVGNVTEFTLRDLTEGETYFFAATAYDTEVPSLESGYSNEVSATIEEEEPPPDTTPPAIVTGFDITNIQPKPPSSEMEISNMAAVSGGVYEVIQEGLQNGELVYVDRTYTFTGVPEYLQGATYIKTVNDDKNSTGDIFLRFDINQDATVYVGYDIRIDPIPVWLLNFINTGDEIDTSDTTFKLFAKDFSAGTVTLGGNYNDDTGISMYTVIVVRNMEILPPPQGNIALNKNISSSGTEFDPGSEVRVVDGIVNEQGLFWAASGSPNWVSIDLGSTYTIGRVKVNPFGWGSPSYYYAAAWNVKYSLEGSPEVFYDFTNPVKVSGTAPLGSTGGVYVTGGDPGHGNADEGYQYYEFTFDLVEARYVQVEITEGDVDGDSNIDEIEVFEGE